jgi:hypothetical protein
MTPITPHANRSFKGDPIDRAFAAYFRTEGAYAAQPSNHSDVQEHAGKEYVVLRNVNGILAVYRIRPSGELKRLRRWPTELERF